MSDWIIVRLSELLTESKIIENNPDPDRKIRVRLNCKGVEKRPLKSEKEGATKNYTRKAGQFIYGKQNFHKGAFGVIPVELDGFSSSGDLPAFDVDSRCSPEWIDYWLKTDNRYLRLAKHAKGVGSQRVNVDSFLQETIALPSLKLQTKIINNINKSCLTLKTLNVENTNQSSYLTKLRQAILQEAIEGKLTTEWRKVNPVRKGDPDYDAEALLEKIQTEKEKLIKEGKIKKQKTLAPIKAEEVPFELPEGWVWTRLGDYSINKDGSRQPISQNQRDRREKIYPYYGASGIIDKIDGYTHEGKNLLIGEDGANLVARSTPIAFIADGKYWVNNHAHVIAFLTDYSLEYYEIHINAIDLKPYITGGFQPKLSQGNLNNITIATPPLAEQQAIVDRVEKLLSMVDELEKQVSERKEQSEQLMQAVLREAFEGGK